MRRTAQSPMSGHFFFLLPLLFYHSSLLFFDSPSCFAWRNGVASLLLSPIFSCCFFSSTHSCFFFNSVKGYCFIPSSAFLPCVPRESILLWLIHGRKRDDKQLKSYRARSLCALPFSPITCLICFGFPPLEVISILFTPTSPRCFICSCFDNVLQVSVSLHLRGNVYIIPHFFPFIFEKRLSELGGACLPHVEICWTITNWMDGKFSHWQEEKKKSSSLEEF